MKDSTKSKEEEPPTLTASQAHLILDEETRERLWDEAGDKEWETFLSTSLCCSTLKAWYHYSIIRRVGWPRKLRQMLRGSSPSGSVVTDEVSVHSNMNLDKYLAVPPMSPGGQDQLPAPAFFRACFSAMRRWRAMYPHLLAAFLFSCVTPP